MKLFEDFNVKKKNKVSAAELLFHACYFRTFQKKKIMDEAYTYTEPWECTTVDSLDPSLSPSYQE